MANVPQVIGFIVGCILLYIVVQLSYRQVYLLLIPSGAGRCFLRQIQSVSAAQTVIRVCVRGWVGACVRAWLGGCVRGWVGGCVRA